MSVPFVYEHPVICRRIPYLFELNFTFFLLCLNDLCFLLLYLWFAYFISTDFAFF